MIGYGIASLEFTEPALDAVLPSCLSCVAAVLRAGFVLLPAGQLNHEDVVLGAETMGKFREKRRAQLTRVVRWHFVGRTRRVLGEVLSVHEFRARFEQDAAFRRHWEHDPRHAVFCAGLARKLEEKRRMCVLAIEGGRSTYGLIGGDAGTLAAMARFHENGV
jgi:hypothetical protein